MCYGLCDRLGDQNERLWSCYRVCAHVLSVLPVRRVCGRERDGVCRMRGRARAKDPDGNRRGRVDPAGQAHAMCVGACGRLSLYHSRPEQQAHTRIHIKPRPNKRLLVP